MISRKSKLRIIVADDNPLALRMLAAIVRTRFDVVAMAQDGTSALDLIRRFQPDIAVLDFEMPGRTGIDVLRELAREVHKTAVVICSVNSGVELISAVRDAGALGFVSKYCSARDLIPALLAAHQHQYFFPSETAPSPAGHSNVSA